MTIYLDPIPTTGDITVKVVDSETGSVISGASVSGASRSGSTNSSGYAYFYDIPFGSYTFTASKSGYYSGSSTASISLSDMSDSTASSQAASGPHEAVTVLIPRYLYR